MAEAMRQTMALWLAWILGNGAFLLVPLLGLRWWSVLLADVLTMMIAIVVGKAILSRGKP
uniref:Uncharacterized protein n=1 Tax=viral metagenome TaxID=1070528 RepID=A0A6H2A4E6_9ZZZZ